MFSFRGVNTRFYNGFGAVPVNFLFGLPLATGNPELLGEAIERGGGIAVIAYSIDVD